MAAFQRRHFQAALDAIEQFNRADTEVALRHQFAQAIASFGYQHLCCVSAPTVHRQSFEQKALLVSWPQGWLEQYRKSNFNAHDPVAAFARIQTKAFKWLEAPIPAHDQLAKSVMIISSSDYRMRCGFCVPIHGLDGFHAAISLAGFDVEDGMEVNATLELIGIYAFNRLANLKSTRRERGILTEREREVLRWTAAGKTAWDTGSILKIAEDTVNKHIASAMRKLDAHTRAQVVAESIRRGEIIP
ncbi:LuxR family transcriptional regulator [uncultured Bradyrhizobium sp.]|uniref:helix-turn-helix transcriptional regulator n=1 Tax=uncultured Bradyrhizobium sp. TaxID=199684 RepID=UPI0035CBD188